METVAVSQAPVVSEASATVAPPVGGATVAALPSTVQDLAKFFLSLVGSSSLGVVGGVADAAASVSGVGAQLYPLTLGGGAVASCAATVMPAGAIDSPAAPATVPGSSGCQQRQEVSRSSRRCHRSSSDGAGRSKKKRTRDRSLFPGHSSRRREKSYGSSSESSEDDRAAAFPPISRHAPGGTPGDSRPAPAGDRLPRPGPSGWRPLSSAGVERYRPGFGSRLSPAPLGEADNDRSSALDALGIDRDDSFRSALALIRNFHSMEEPVGVPSARCKTFLALIYGLTSETSPAFHLPTSPLMRSLLDDTNLALSKFLEDQTVHGFLPVPSRRHRRYYHTSSSLFRDRIQSLLGLLLLPKRKLVRPGSVPFPCRPHRSPRWRPCFPGYVRWPPGWTGGCPRAEVSVSICLPKFVPTSKGLYSLYREPWSSG